MHADAFGVRLAALPLDGYGRLFRLLSGGDGHLLVCDESGSALWSADATGDAAATTLAWWQEQALLPGFPAEEAQEHAVNGSAFLGLRPLRSPIGKRIGWLVGLVSPNGGTPPPEKQVLAGALDDLGACIEREAALADEVDDIALELTDRYEELNLVYGLAGHIRNYDDVDTFLQRILDTCLGHLDLDAAAIIDHAGEHTAVAETIGCDIPNLDLVLTELRGNLYHFATAGRETLVLNSAEEPRRAYLLPNLPYKVVATPIRREDAEGFLLVVLNRNDKRDFSNSDRTLLSLIADQVSIVLRVHRILHQMRSFTRQMAAALISAVEAKDAYTRGHSERVHRISMKIGEALELRDGDREQLFWGSLLHDVGKIGIPDAILGKPGRLTDDEFTFIKVHPERSYEILSHIEYIGEGKLGARHHQEKYDGSGYPQGLKGKNIPLLARIIAVADTYDAMTSSRAYRAGCGPEEALSEIQRVAGSQLDPEIVQIFLDLCRNNPAWLTVERRTGGFVDE